MIQETVVKIVTRMTELSVDDVKISKPETLGYGHSPEIKFNIRFLSNFHKLLSIVQCFEI